MTKEWRRKHSPNEKWKETRQEDVFLCRICKGYFPWWRFTTGNIIEFGPKNDEDTYELMNDDKDRGGREWACNMCISNLLFENEYIVIKK